MLAEVMATPVATHALLMGPYFICTDVTGTFPVAVGTFSVSQSNSSVPGMDLSLFSERCLVHSEIMQLSI